MAAGRLTHDRDSPRIDAKFPRMPPEPADGFAEVVDDRGPTRRARPGKPIVDREHDESALGQTNDHLLCVVSKRRHRAADPASTVDGEHRRSQRPGYGRVGAARGAVNLERSAAAHRPCDTPCSHCGKYPERSNPARPRSAAFSMPRQTGLITRNPGNELSADQKSWS